MCVFLAVRASLLLCLYGPTVYSYPTAYSTSTGPVPAAAEAQLATPRAATLAPAAASADCPVELTGTPECADWAAEHAVKPPAHCEVTAFGNWAPCTRSCGGGDTWRARTVISNVLDQPCPALHDFMICENEPCGR
jgi:hypothetical protein